MNKYTIRFIEEDEIPQLIQLCKEHAKYEQASYSNKGKVKNLEKDLFDISPKLYSLVVESSGILLGFTTYMLQYSTWDAEEYVYMDCLFLLEEARGFGIGESLIRRIQSETKKLGCNHIQWQTPKFNTRAVKFYKRIGATSKAKERFFWEVD